MKKLDLEVLQQFLNNNQGKIPKPTKGVKTLFDVMKQPHLENVWSNIYAFFFNPEEDHGFGNLFLRTLVEIIKEKQHGRDFVAMADEYIDIKTEDSTDDSKRLDIALQSDNYAILIENKVYADLYNNLGVYWRNYPQYDKNNKQGVVLSLYPKTISLEGRGKELDHDPEKWVNVTHLELMKRVSKNLHYCLLNGSDKYLSFFREFYQNIKNITMAMDNENMQFYIDNIAQLKEINLHLNGIKDLVFKQIKSEVLKGKGFVSRSEKGHCWGFYFRKKGDGNNIMIAVICKGLFPADSNNDIPNNSIVVTVEVQRELSSKVRENFKNIFNDEEKNFIGDLPTDNGFHTWVGVKYIPITTVDDLRNISANIDKALREDDGILFKIYNKITAFAPPLTK